MKLYAADLLLHGLLVNIFSRHKSMPLVKIFTPGLAAEESLFFATGFFKKIWAQVRYYLIKQIENEVFSLSIFKNNTKQINFELVSEQMKNHLLNLYPELAKAKITLAQAPKAADLTAEQMLDLKIDARKWLNIDLNRPVYLYAGSLKPWQCFNKTITFFKNILKKKPDAILLILTHEQEQAIKEIKTYNIATENYMIFKATHALVSKYMQAADYGLILRQPHIVNWVSRPLKALEYRQNGLIVIHNMTVGWIIKNC
jgi:hypothetical protein